MRSKVTVIGAGLSGLAAGIRLIRQGFRVTLLEANDAVGGCCSTSTVDGYTFNNGAMYVAMPGLIDHAFARLGLDRQALLPLRRINVPQTSVLPGGTRVTLVDDHGNASIEGDNAAARTATLQAELKRCVDKWGPVLRLFADELMPYPLALSRMISKAWRHLPKLTGNLAGDLNRSFSDPEARAAVSAVTLYTGLAAEHTPVFQILGLVTMLDDGFYLPEGGMNAITRVLRKAFLELGGELHTGTRVKRILVGSGKVRALLFDGNAEVSADIVVSTATAMTTFACLMAPADVPASMRHRLKRAPLSSCLRRSAWAEEPIRGAGLYGELRPADGATVPTAGAPTAGHSLAELHRPDPHLAGTLAGRRQRHRNVHIGRSAPVARRLGRSLRRCPG